MPSKNRRIATYLPPSLDTCLKEFIATRNIRGQSAALIEILSEYFGVSQEVAQKVDSSRYATLTQFKDLSDQVSALSNKIDLSDSLGELGSELLVKLMQLEEGLKALNARQNELQNQIDRVVLPLPAKEILTAEVKSDPPFVSPGQLSWIPEEEDKSALSLDEVPAKADGVRWLTSRQAYQRAVAQGCDRSESGFKKWSRRNPDQCLADFQLRRLEALSTRNIAPSFEDMKALDPVV